MNSTNSTQLFDQLPVAISNVPLLAKLIVNSVCAGFPSPAEDLGAQRIDLAQMLVVHPQATSFLRASGQSMIEAGIFDKDIMVVDRAIKPRHNHIVVAVVNGDFTVKRFYQRAGRGSGDCWSASDLPTLLQHGRGRRHAS